MDELNELILKGLIPFNGNPFGFLLSLSIKNKLFSQTIPILFFASGNS
jgi:hypothetical protein